MTVRPKDSFATGWKRIVRQAFCLSMLPTGWKPIVPATIYHFGPILPTAIWPLSRDYLQPQRVNSKVP